MNFHFTDIWWLLGALVAVPWTLWLAAKTDVQISKWRRGVSLFLRLVIVALLVLAMAGLQWMRPLEGMNLFFVLDRSDSIPSTQQEAARVFVNKLAAKKKPIDKAGAVVFGTGASIESSANPALDLQKIHAVVGSERTDIAGAIRLATAAFPENGQKRIVLVSDGNENIGEAMSAAMAAKPLGVSIDVIPLGVARGNDVSIQKVTLPSQVKKGQTFEVKIFAQADKAQKGTIRLYRDEQLLGSQEVQLEAGKNLFTFPQTLDDPKFYRYDVQLDAPGDLVAQNNRASSFTSVQGDPRVLLVSSEPAQEDKLAAALRSANVDVKLTDISGFPGTLAEMQSYDSIFLCNIAAGDLGDTMMKLLESAVRDFGVGLVCVGGDQAYAAGGYRGTPLESTLPLEMELSSKKVLPSGALVIVCHATEFPNGNQWARDIAFAALEALGPQDEMGIVLWNGTDQWLFDLQPVKEKKKLGRMIAGMTPGDMPNFQHVMEMAHEGLKKSKSSLKHMVVFSDGDPGAPTAELMKAIVGDRITVSTVMIGGHVLPETMISIKDQGKGRFYDVTSPSQLPQIFLKEAAVILKSAIYEEPFKPKQVAGSELTRGIPGTAYPTLRGYVATTPKARAEIPLVTDKGDPLLAHWQYGLGRAVAFTSDARAKWASDWLGWDRYRQFWTQIGQWALRRVDSADFTTDVSVEKGEGVISVEAVDSQGNFRNFLNLQTIVVSPKGERQVVRLEQTGPGHYEARFPTKDVGAYQLNLMDMKDGQPRASQRLGASVNYSPEFSATEPNMNLLQRLTEATGGKVIELGEELVNPFLHDRQKTFQPRDLWEWLLKLAILLFPLDVAVRRIQLDREEWLKATRNLRRWIFFWKPAPRPQEADESLAALLSRREEVRARQTAPVAQPPVDLFRPEKPVVLAAEGDRPAPPVVGPTTASTATGSEKPAEEPANTTSRLLQAKRRAQKKK